MKKANFNNSDIKLDEYEQEISHAIDHMMDENKLNSVKNMKKELAFAEEAATNFFRKDERVTLRLSSSDLARLKQKAAYKGLPYQTFIASVLHEYAAGHFGESV